MKLILRDNPKQAPLITYSTWDRPFDHALWSTEKINRINCMMTLGLWNQTQPQRLGVYLPINNSNQLYSRKEIHSRDTIHVGDHLKHREIHYHLMWRKVIMHKYCWFAILNICQLEQLERLRYEDTLRRLMITNTIESYWIPSQKKTNSKS